MPDPILRPVQTSDADALTDLWMAFLNEQATHDDRFAPSDDAAQRFRNDVPLWVEDGTRWLHVAEVDGELVGFVSAHRWAPAPIYAFSSEVYLDALYVVPERRKEGIGRKLCEATMAWADDLGAARVRLVTLGRNALGRSFWEAVGATDFSITMTIELDGPSGEAEVKPKGRLGF